LQERKHTSATVVLTICGMLAAFLFGNCGDGPTGDDPKPELVLAPDSLDFGDTREYLTLTLTTVGGNGEIAWRVGSSQAWISVFPDSGSVDSRKGDDRVIVEVDRSQLAAGEHAGSVVVDYNGGQASVGVGLFASRPMISVNSHEVDFESHRGSSSLEIGNSGTGDLIWEFEHDLSWLSVEPAQGRTGAEATSVLLTAQRRELEPGSYTGKMRLVSNAVNEPVIEFGVKLQVVEGAVLTVRPDSLSFGTVGDELTLEIGNTGSSALVWQMGTEATWIEIGEVSGRVEPGTFQEVQIAVARTGLEPGEYAGELVVRAGEAGEAVLPVQVGVSREEQPPERELTVTFSGADFLLEDVEIEFVWIEPGTFAMGSPQDEEGRNDDEGPVHQVAISKGFYLGKYELTQDQWETVMETRPWEGRSYTRLGSRYPAVYLSWEDVGEFVDRLNDLEERKLYRLPTEAEWEYACRAGTTTRWAHGEEEGGLGEYAWYIANAAQVGESYAHEVGMKKPNPWGLYDMHGNAWEWCWDWYGEYTGNDLADPVGRSSGTLRVTRGGSFSSFARGVRSSARDGVSPVDLNIGLGVRLLRVQK